MGYEKMNVDQGHWILAKMGKRVLRPGGKELTNKLVEHLNITSKDDIVEFAPGVGYTAEISLKKHPNSYTGIELNEVAANKLIHKFHKQNALIVNSNAAQTGLNNDSIDKVYGEAMLTMQANHRKSEIIREAHRILKKGGLYGIHELGLQPNDLPENIKQEIQLKLAKAIKVNARPMTEKEWQLLLEKEGFEVVNVFSNEMALLEPKRILTDEGLLRTLKIIFNILTHPKERKRILEMKALFKANQDKLSGIVLIARKK